MALEDADCELEPHAVVLALALVVRVERALVVELGVADMHADRDAHAEALAQLDGDDVVLRETPSDVLGVLLEDHVAATDADASAEAVVRALCDEAAVGDDAARPVTDVLLEALPHTEPLLVLLTVAVPVAHTDAVPDVVCVVDAHGDALAVALAQLDTDGDAVCDCAASVGDCDAVAVTVAVELTVMDSEPVPDAESDGLLEPLGTRDTLGSALTVAAGVTVSDGDGDEVPVTV